MMAAAGCRAEIADDPPASRRDREEGEYAVAMPADVQMVLGLQPADMDVGEIPVAVLRAALEGEAEAMARR